MPELLHDKVVEAVDKLMARNNISYADLARALKVSRSAVTQMFQPGNRNWTLARLDEVAHALGCRVGIIVGPDVEQFRPMVDAADKCETQGKVRIWSGEHQAWWRPNSAGYCLDVRDAGLYDRDEAERIVKHCGPEKKIAIKDA